MIGSGVYFCGEFKAQLTADLFCFDLTWLMVREKAKAKTLSESFKWYCLKQFGILVWHELSLTLMM